MRARIPLLAAVIAGAALYAPVVTALFRQWLNDASTAHGILLVAAAGFVFVRQLPHLRRQPLDPTGWGLAVALFGLLLYALGTLGAEVFVLRLSLPVVALGGVMALYGRRQARLLLSAFGLVLLAIPLPAVLVTSVTLPMQLLASRLAETLLTAGGVNVMRDGNLLRLDHAMLDVAEACSGLRSVISLIAVGAVCAALFRMSRTRGALIMALGVPVAVVGNGARIAATGYMTQWFGEGAARGLPHDVTGYVAFALMFGAMVTVIRMTRPSRHAPSGAIPARA
jgi:exosortase